MKIPFLPKLWIWVDGWNFANLAEHDKNRKWQVVDPSLGRNTFGSIGKSPIMAVFDPLNYSGMIRKHVQNLCKIHVFLVGRLGYHVGPRQLEIPTSQYDVCFESQKHWLEPHCVNTAGM